LKRQAPGTRVVVREGAMDALLPELHRGTLDLIVGRLTDGGDSIGQEALHAGHGVVVAGPDHPLARRRRLAWKDVAPYPWVLPPAGTLSRESLENTLRRHGVGLPEDAIETLSIHVIAGYLQIAPALGLLAEPIARHYLDWGWLARLPLELPEPPRPIGMTWSRAKAVTPALERFMQCLREAAREDEPRAAPARQGRLSPRGG
jgi:DNA-binding transcriptional LysR family regulator